MRLRTVSYSASATVQIRVPGSASAASATCEYRSLDPTRGLARLSDHNLGWFSAAARTPNPTGRQVRARRHAPPTGTHPLTGEHDFEPAPAVDASTRSSSISQVAEGPLIMRSVGWRSERSWLWEVGDHVSGAHDAGVQVEQQGESAATLDDTRVEHDRAASAIQRAAGERAVDRAESPAYPDRGTPSRMTPDVLEDKRQSPKGPSPHAANDVGGRKCPVYAAGNTNVPSVCRPPLASTNHCCCHVAGSV